MEGAPLTRCLVADDHPALIAAVTLYLVDAGYEIVGPATDGLRTVALLEAEKPELALVDFRMPRLEGPELIRRLKEVSPDTAIAVYSADVDAKTARDALGAGASAVLLKEAPIADLGRALEALLSGRSYLDPTLVEAAPARGALTSREVDVLSLLAEGFSHDAIGGRLSISAETVRTHVRKAADRLDAKNRTEAVATALRLGLIV
jgi:DNA-binding NarL/FixJ family response regulator